MRVWKFYKGVIADFVVVVGVFVMPSAGLLAQKAPVNVMPRLEQGVNGPGPSQPVPMPSPPMNGSDLEAPSLKDGPSIPSSDRMPGEFLPGQKADALPPGANKRGPEQIPAPKTDPAFSLPATGQPPRNPDDSVATPEQPRVPPGTFPPFNKGNGGMPKTDPPPPPRRMGGAPSSGPKPNSVPPTLRDERASKPSNSRMKPRAGNQNESDIYKVVPQTCVPAKGQFIWNFEDEELTSVLRQVSDLLCRTIIINDTIGKSTKMTIIGKSPITPKDAWDVLLASLASKGLTLIEQGKTWTVVKRNESKSFATPMYSTGKSARNNEEIGTLFYKMQHASQETLKNVARVLISKDGMVESIGDQYIIVIDSNSNIRRLGNIFDQIDVEDAINKIHIIPLLNADSKTIEKQLRDLFDIVPGSTRMRRRRAGPNEARSALEIDKIIADERTNSLIVIADKDAVEKLKEVVALMDQPASDQGNKGKIHVKKLRFADAKKIAETLTAVVQQGKGGRFGGRRREEGTNDLFEGDVKITAHESTNTLVTVATPNDYRSLLATINKLDERKEQVYVEAAILDIQVTDSNEFGINLFGGLEGGMLGLNSGALGVFANPGGVGIVKGVSTSLTAGATAGAANVPIGALAVLGNFLSGGVAGLVGPQGANGIPSFGAVLQALAKNSQVDVLSTPYLLTTDNSPAEMSVGEKIPVVRGTSTAGGGGIGAALGVPLQNVTYEPVNLTFKITPHVGADDNVRLDIEQEVNELGNPEDILNQKQYRIRTKSAKTTLVLKDQQTGVIGGLISHKSGSSDNKIPFLGDIPLLGWLFKTRKSDNERRNLALVITPYIIRTDEDYKKIVERKLKEREEFAQLYYGGKVKNYNKHIDYDKKAGPLSSLLLSVDGEMKKAENGGSGDGNEVIITPKDGAPSAQKEPQNLNINERPAINDETAYFGGEPLPDDFLLKDFDPSAQGGLDKERDFLAPESR